MSSADRGEAVARSARWLQGWPQLYGFALISVSAATLLRYALDVALGFTQPFILFYPTITLIALLSGFGPAFFATLLSAAMADYFLMEPLNAFAGKSARDLVGLSLFAVMGIATSAMGALFRQRGQRLEEFEKAGENLEEMITVVDRDYRYVGVNSAFLNYRGMKREDLLGRHIREVLDPAVFESTIKQRLDECFQGKIVQYETRYAYPTLGLRDLFISYFPMEGPGGVGRVTCLLRDVTERKKAETALRESEQKFRKLFETSPVAILVAEAVDDDEGRPNFRYLDVNPALERLVGMKACDLIGRTVWEATPFANPASVEHYVRVARTGVWDHFTGFSPRINKHWEAISYSPRLGQSISFFTDITERAQAEQALRESEEKFRALADFVPQMVWMCTPDGLSFYFNQRWLDYTGMSLEESYGRGWNTPFHDDDKQRAWDAWNHAVATGEPYQVESRLRSADGSYKWFLMQGKPSRDASGSIVKWFGACTDIDEMKKAEAGLRESEASLKEAQRLAQLGSYVFDFASGTWTGSEALNEVLGIDATWERSLAGWLALVHPDDRTRMADYAEIEVIGQTETFNQEYRIVRPADQAERWLWGHATLERDAQGRPVRMCGTSMDITERKRAEMALRASEQRYRLLFEKNVAGVAITSVDGKVLDCNEAWARLLGYTVEEFRGRAAADFYFHPEDREPLLRDLRQQGAFFSREMALRGKYGEAVWVLFNSVIIEHGPDGVPVVQGTAIDITQRRIAEQELRRREEDYRSFVAQSSEGIFREELDTPIAINRPEDELVEHILRHSYLAECNDAMGKMYGLATGQELLGKRLTEMLVVDDPRNVELTRDYIRSGFKVVDRVSHEVDAHGNRKVFRNSMTGIVEDGKLVRTWGIQRDVTQQTRLEEARSRAEKALKDSENHFRFLVEQAADGIFIANPQGRYLDVNSAGAEMLGYTPAEILKLSITDVVVAEETVAVTDERDRILEGQATRNEWTFRRKDGSTFPGEVLGKRLPDGRLQGILRDISERKAAEKAMRQSEERFRIALKDSPITVFSQDRDLRYTWIYNPRTYWQQDVIGKTDAEIVGAKKAASLVEVKRRVLKTGVAVRQEVFIPHNGKSEVFDISIEPLFDTDGNIVGITGASMDIAHLRELTDRLQDARDKLAQEKSYLEEQIQAELGFEQIIGRSPALVEVLKNVRVVAPTDSTVLLLGETGTGKELVARSVHALSSRRNQTFIKLNCAAVPEGLLESELFGHEKGAFTGAVNQKVGRIELADKGTLFLDEIGEMPLDLQPKLLRVLQDRELERLGGVRTLHVDVRIISATNRDLHQDVLDKRFREDLFYRLNVFPIDLPPLRQRRGDIPILVNHFLKKHSARMGKHIDDIPDEAMKVLQDWNWPGNIRELENMIERMVILTKGRTLAPPPVELDAPQDLTEDNLTEMEREHIIRVLRETNGILSGVDGAATRLGIKRTTLQSMLKRFGIELHDFRRGNGTFGAV